MRSTPELIDELRQFNHEESADALEDYHHLVKIGWRVSRDYKQALDNLTETQNRCNELLEENRRLKAELALRPKG